MTRPITPLPIGAFAFPPHRRFAGRSVATLFASIMVAGTAAAQDAADAVAPETGEASTVGGMIPEAPAPVTSENWMVAAANPLAAEAGARVLREGGTAADAMVAVQAVLGLVEPQSSGLGGGAFLVWFDAESGEVTTLDGRETAPAAATGDMFIGENGEPLKFFDAVVGGLSVGVPGTPKLMEAAHERWGNQEFASLLTEAIALARDGFEVSPRLAGAVADGAERLGRFETTASYFLPGGEPIAEGSRLTNEPYAQTLETFASEGADAFYSGPIVEEIVSVVTGAEGNPGRLAAEDFASYEVKERPPVCAPFMGASVCGMGPPSSGALTVGQILMMTEALTGGDLDPTDANAWHIVGDASRLAFADRGRYMADSDFVDVPAEGLLDQTYMEDRAALIGPQALEDAAPGEPPRKEGRLQWADDQSLELPSTSHISIVDAAGNALSMTTTIENGFGSRLMANGYLLNNELTDFSFRPEGPDGSPIANRVEPGKRPRSSMSPTIVLRDGAPVFVVGSPGGSRIIGYVTQTILAHMAMGLDPQAAVSQPHLVKRFGAYDLEEGTAAAEFAPALEALGHETNVRDLNSGLHAIAIREDGTLVGGADPRREGVAIGE